MSNIVPFEKAAVPGFLGQQNTLVTDDDLTANVGAGFAVMSIMGKNFTIRRGKESELINKTDSDGDVMPASSIEVVILRANKNFSKTWYATGWIEGSDAKPDCASTNGDVPDAGVPNPQSKACATCPKNEWGSKISESGTKVKACSDVRRIAIAPAGQLNDPMLLRIPPATLKPLAEYGATLKKRGVPYNAVVTKLRFDPEAPSPKLMFTPLRFLTEAEYAEVQEITGSEMVQAIVQGTAGAAIAEHHEEQPIAGTPPKQLTTNKVTIEDGEAPVTTKPRAGRPRKPAAVEEPAAQPAAKPAAAAPAPRTVNVNIVDDISELLDQSDD